MVMSWWTLIVPQRACKAGAAQPEDQILPVIDARLFRWRTHRTWVQEEQWQVRKGWILMFHCEVLHQCPGLNDAHHEIIEVLYFFGGEKMYTNYIYIDIWKWLSVGTVIQWLQCNCVNKYLMLRNVGFIIVQILFLYFLHESVAFLRHVKDIVTNTVDLHFPPQFDNLLCVFVLCWTTLWPLGHHRFPSAWAAQPTEQQVHKVQVQVPIPALFLSSHTFHCLFDRTNWRPGQGGANWGSGAKCGP